MKMIAAERLEFIGERLRRERVASTAGLSRMLGVSEMTIRRDLKRLEELGLCRRTRGGAVMVRSTLVRETHYSHRELLHVAEKVAIGRAAQRTIEEGETIFIDAGTTTAQLAAALRERHNITIVTNSLHVLAQLCDSPGITLLATGGNVSPAMNGALGHGDRLLVGPLAEATIRRFRPSKAFMGTTGIAISDGLSTELLEQAVLNRLVMQMSAKVILLADHTKFGRVASSIVGPVTLLDRVITDTGLSSAMRSALQDLGIEVITVEPALDIPWVTSGSVPVSDSQSA